MSDDSMCSGDCDDCDKVQRLNDRASQLEVEAHNLRNDAEVIRRKHIRNVTQKAKEKFIALKNDYNPDSVREQPNGIGPRHDPR